LKKKIFALIRFIFFLSLGAGLFWLAIKDADIKKILEEFKKANYFWVGISIIVMVLSHWFRALRWNLLINTMNHKPKQITTFYAVLIGYFVNLAIPRLGEVTRCGVLSKHEKIPVNAVIGTVIVERAFDMICLFIIILLTILAQLDFLGGFIDQHIITPMSLKFSSGAAVILMIVGFFVAVGLLCFLIYKFIFPRISHKSFYIKTKEIVLGFWTGIKTIIHLKTKKRFLFYSFLIWFCYMLTIYICFNAIEETAGLSIMDAVTILAIGSIGTLAPTPGGIGAYQFMVGLTLTKLFLIGKIPALSFANIIYFAQWIIIVILGTISWMILFASQKRQKNEPIGIDPEENI
jgi:glycosyltransferase 2 family protein